MPIRGVREHSHESVLGEWTRRPAVGAIVGEPVVGETVVHVVRIEEGDQDIDVEKRWTFMPHPATR